MKAFKTLFVILMATTLCNATDKIPGIGPKGGKLFENSAPRAEFFIEKDNRVIITFYDDKLKPVAVGGQVVSVSAEPKAGKVKLELEKKNGALVSKLPLPKPGFFDEYQITVLIKASPDARPETFHVRFDLDVCRKCGHKEYTCTCPR